MKHYNIRRSLLFAVVYMICLSCQAQPADEIFIKNLDNEERLAVLKGDSTALFTKYWSADMVVNTPANIVGNVEGTKKHVRDGKLDYSVFDRDIEKISLFGDMAIVMGLETLRPQGKSDNVGKTVKRRFTNIWMKQKEGWRMVARQATIIAVL